MKILLINPFGSNWVEGSEDVTETAIRMAPIGILSIAAYLLEKGHEVEVHDCRGAVSRIGADDVLSRVRSFKPDMVGFTAVTSGFLNAYRLTEEIKKTVPHVTIVFGGVHVSALRAKILESYPDIDFLVTGEGEKAMAELASGAKPGTIQGLVYREGTGDQRQRPEDRSVRA